jgi:hypothetical protein
MFMAISVEGIIDINVTPLFPRQLLHLSSARPQKTDILKGILKQEEGIVWLYSPRGPLLASGEQHCFFA